MLGKNHGTHVLHQVMQWPEKGSGIQWAVLVLFGTLGQSWSPRQTPSSPLFAHVVPPSPLVGVNPVESLGAPGLKQA